MKEEIRVLLEVTVVIEVEEGEEVTVSVIMGEVEVEVVIIRVVMVEVKVMVEVETEVEADMEIQGEVAEDFKVAMIGEEGIDKMEVTGMAEIEEEVGEVEVAVENKIN